MNFRLQKRELKSHKAINPIVEFPWVRVASEESIPHNDQKIPTSRNISEQKLIKSTNADDTYGDHSGKRKSTGRRRTKQKDNMSNNGSMQSSNFGGSERFPEEDNTGVEKDVKCSNNLKLSKDAKMTEDVSSTSKSKPSETEDDDEGQYMEIEMKHCTTCDKSFAPPTYKKLCAMLDRSGNPKCVKMYKTKRKVFSSARVSLFLFVTFINLSL